MRLQEETDTGRAGAGAGRWPLCPEMVKNMKNAACSMDVRGARRNHEPAGHTPYPGTCLRCWSQHHLRFVRDTNAWPHPSTESEMRPGHLFPHPSGGLDTPESLSLPDLWLTLLFPPHHPTPVSTGKTDRSPGPREGMLCVVGSRPPSPCPGAMVSDGWEGGRMARRSH